MSPRQKKFGDSIRTIVVAVLSGLFVGVSLLAFPDATMVMVAGWLVFHTVLVATDRPGWVPLAVCVVILLIKHAAWFPTSALLLAILAAVILLRLVEGRTTLDSSGLKDRAALALVWFAWLVATLYTHEAAHTGRRPGLDRRPVVCLGDSLTESGYPDCLARELTVSVVNLGRNGFSTTDALKLLPEIREARPQAVVVELGGHDFLREHGEDTCRQNLETIIRECRAMDAEVVLVEIPRGIVRDPFGGLERRLARLHDLEMISDTTLRWFVLLGPYAPPGRWLPTEYHFSDDGLHPNERGNELLAAAVCDALARIYGGEIKADCR